MVPQRAASRNVGANAGANKSRDCISSSHGQLVKDKFMVGEYQEDASNTTHSITGTITKTFDEDFNPFDVGRDPPKEFVDKKENYLIPSHDVESKHAECQRKVQFLTGDNATSQEMEWVQSIK